MASPAIVSALRAVDAWLDLELAAEGDPPAPRSARRVKNCGTGAGGFRPGNTCGRGGRARRATAEWKRERKRRFHRMMVRRFPFLEGKPIGLLDYESIRGVEPNHKLSDAQWDAITAGRPARVVRSHEAETREGRLRTEVTTNPLGGIMAEEARFYVESRVDSDRFGVRGFNDRKKAYEAARREHAGYAREFGARRTKGLDRRRGKAAVATDDNDVPSVDAILARCLVAAGHADAWTAGTLDDAGRREVLALVAAEGKSRLRAWAEELIGGGVEVEKALLGGIRQRVTGFFGRADAFIRELITAGVLAVAGPGPIGQAMEEEIERGHAEQVEYLDKFRRQILDEDRPLDGTFVARAEMYGSAAWLASLEAERRAIIRSGSAKQERRVLGAAEEHCESTPDQPGCVELANRGWVPVGTLPRLGETPCKSGCVCWFEFR